MLTHAHDSRAFVRIRLNTMQILQAKRLSKASERAIKEGALPSFLEISTMINTFYCDKSECAFFCRSLESLTDKGRATLFHLLLNDYVTPFGNGKFAFTRKAMNV